jgi:hypothetical protein
LWQPAKASGGGARCKADRHGAGNTLSGGPHVNPRLIALPKNELSVAIKDLACLRGRHATRRANQELLADFGLQRCQLLAQSGLSHVKDICRLCQIADIDNLHEVLEAFEVHDPITAPGTGHELGSSHSRAIRFSYVGRLNLSWLVAGCPVSCQGSIRDPRAEQ